ncbi:MAG: hypothetical protein LDLANPLL_02015 [Turneriella sp.]|nr:hypothetical protein [Turneriella sp.]
MKFLSFLVLSAFYLNLYAAGNDAANRALKDAIRKGEAEKAKTAIAAGADVNRKQYGATLFMEACRKGNIEIVQTMLDAGAEIDPEAYAGSSPLTYAAQSGHTKIVELLLSRGARLEPRDGYQSALHIAAEKGHRDTVELLIERGANLNNSASGESLIVRTLMYKKKNDMILLLLSKGAGINAFGEYGKTLLDYAIREKQVELVKLLLGRGADINVRDDSGLTPLISSVWSGNLDMVKLLVEKGADLNLRSSDGSTALDTAIYLKKPQLVEYLAGIGAKTGKDAGTEPFKEIASEFTCELGKKYRLVVAFTSFGAGPDSIARAKLNAFIRDYPRRVRFGSGGGGPEGEYSLCFTLDEVSREEQKDFIERVAKSLAEHSGVAVKTNAVVRGYF